jgi:hypothetical protein
MVKRWWWLLPAAAGAVLVALIMVVLPPDRTIDNPGEVLFRLSPLLLVVLAVAGFPQRPGPGLVLLAVLVVGYMGVIDSLNVMRILEYATAADRSTAFPRLYQFMLFVNAFTVTAVLFGYRLGGANTANVLKAGIAAILVVISGLNDLTFYYTYDWTGERPGRLDWASHIAVFVGGSPTPAVAIGFCLVHIGLAVTVLALPMQRWLDRLAGRFSTVARYPREGAR